MSLRQSLMADIKIFLNCEKCGFSTYWDFSLASHVKNSHRSVWERSFNCNQASVEKLQCSDCDYGTHMKVEFDIHTRGHDWDYPEFIHEIQEEFRPDQWECPQCDFKTFTNLLSHSHNCEQDFLSELKIEDIKTECSYNSINTSDLKEDVCDDIPVPKIEWFTCDQCSYKTGCKRSLKTHFQRCHHTTSEALIKFKCEQCSYTTTYKHNLRRHVKYMHISKDDVVWFKCDQCPYKSNDKGNLKRHVADKHKPSAQIKCEHCSFKAKGKSHLKYHIKAKHSSRDGHGFHVLNCAHCDYKSHYKSCLRKHVNAKHTLDYKAEWFKCDQCTYKAKSKTCITSHVINHHVRLEDVKWFECDQCAYKCKTRNNMRSHMIYNHLKPEDVKWFYCGHCDHKSKQNASLKKHIASKHLKINN